MNTQTYNIQLPEKELVESLWYSDFCQSVAELCELTGAILVTWISVSSYGDIHENKSVLVEDSSLRFSRYTYLHLTSELLATQPRGYRCRGMNGLPQEEEVLARLASEAQPVQEQEPAQKQEPELKPEPDINSSALVEPTSPVIHCSLLIIYCSFYIVLSKFSPSSRPCIRGPP